MSKCCFAYFYSNSSYSVAHFVFFTVGKNIRTANVVHIDKGKTSLDGHGMEAFLLQLIGGVCGGSTTGKIFHTSDIGLVSNALTGALGGIAGGQLIGTLLGTTASSSGLDVGAIIGPLIDGALTGALAQVAIGAIVSKLRLSLNQAEGYSRERS